MTVEVRIRALIDAARVAYEAQVTDPKARASITEIFDQLGGQLSLRDTPGERLPACAHLETALENGASANGVISPLIDAFRAAEPDLAWYKRSGDTTNCNEAYWEGHANAMIAGPGGRIRSSKVWLGVSLLAPGVRYPDHTHPPEETYLVLSEGDFFQGGRGWFTPGLGGTFYNPPGILHAMRSHDAPLFAMWALRA